MCNVDELRVFVENKINETQNSINKEFKRLKKFSGLPEDKIDMSKIDKLQYLKDMYQLNLDIIDQRNRFKGLVEDFQRSIDKGIYKINNSAFPG